MADLNDFCGCRRPPGGGGREKKKPYFLCQISNGPRGDATKRIFDGFSANSATILIRKFLKSSVPPLPENPPTKLNFRHGCCDDWCQIARAPMEWWNNEATRWIFGEQCCDFDAHFFQFVLLAHSATSPYSDEPHTMDMVMLRTDFPQAQQAGGSTMQAHGFSANSATISMPMPMPMPL